MTQLQLFWKAYNDISIVNQTFDFFVKNGLTKKELENNIKKRPELWKRFENWLSKLK